MPAFYYPAIIDRSQSGFGATFPDFPGCIAHGDTVGEACVQAEKALALHLEGMRADKDDIPQPSDFAEVCDLDGEDDIACVMIRADVPQKIERVLVSIDANLLRCIDSVASNRSAFLAEAARCRLKGLVADGIKSQGELATMNLADIEQVYGLKPKSRAHA